MQADVTYEEALERLLKAVGPVEPETLPLEECFSRVLAEDFAAEMDVPPFDRSPYDGYALRASDTASASPDGPVTLRILEEIPAGSTPRSPITAGTAAKILTGGVSVEDYDLTELAMARIGAEVLFHGCRIKPGMACAYGVRGGKLICALSGNPASAITNFHLLARPALLKRCGRRDFAPEHITVSLADGFGKKSPVMRILRGKLDLSDGTVRMRLDPDQGNVVLSSTIGCDALAFVPAGSGAVTAGTRLEAIVL